MSFIAKADDPVAVVREILAGGPVPAPEFRERAYERGIPKKEIGKACRDAGADCVRYGPPGAGGWQWQLGKPEDFGIIKRPNRRGLHAKFFFRGREIQRKLTDDDDMEAAKLAMAELVAQLEEEDTVFAPYRRRSEPPAYPPREEMPVTLADCMRDVARQLVRLCRKARQLEGKSQKEVTHPTGTAFIPEIGVTT